MSPETNLTRRLETVVGDILTIRDVAVYLTLPISTAYRLAERRRLPGCKVGRQWRFHKAALDDWFRRQANVRHVSILVVDDEPRIRELFSSSLHADHRTVLTAASGEEALVMARHTEFDVVLLDLAMPGLNGVETFRELRAIRPWLPVIIVTGHPDSDLMAQALAVGPFTLIPKPIDMKTLRQTVSVLVGHTNVASEARTSVTAQRGGQRMLVPGRLVIVQRGHEALYDRLCHQHWDTAFVVVDRRTGERRRGGTREGIDRRLHERRRAPTRSEHAMWQESRYLVVDPTR
jgi:excisionase family DNA binding protein